jgi:hypothetical protein
MPYRWASADVDMIPTSAVRITEREYRWRRCMSFPPVARPVRHAIRAARIRPRNRRNSLDDAKACLRATQLDRRRHQVAGTAAVGVDGPAHDAEQRRGGHDNLDFEQFLHFPCGDEVDDGEVEDDEEHEADEARGGDARGEGEGVFHVEEGRGEGVEDEHEGLAAEVHLCALYCISITISYIQS